MTRTVTTGKWPRDLHCRYDLKTHIKTASNLEESNLAVIKRKLSLSISLIKNILMSDISDNAGKVSGFDVQNISETLSIRIRLLLTAMENLNSIEKNTKIFLSDILSYQTKVLTGRLHQLQPTISPTVNAVNPRKRRKK